MTVQIHVHVLQAWGCSPGGGCHVHVLKRPYVYNAFRIATGLYYLTYDMKGGGG